MPNASFNFHKAHKNVTRAKQTYFASTAPVWTLVSFYNWQWISEKVPLKPSILSDNSPKKLVECAEVEYRTVCRGRINHHRQRRLKTLDHQVEIPSISTYPLSIKTKGIDDILNPASHQAERHGLLVFFFFFVWAVQQTLSAFSCNPVSKL